MHAWCSCSNCTEWCSCCRSAGREGFGCQGCFMVRQTSSFASVCFSHCCYCFCVLAATALCVVLLRPCCLRVRSNVLTDLEQDTGSVFRHLPMMYPSVTVISLPDLARGRGAYPPIPLDIVQLAGCATCQHRVHCNTVMLAAAHCTMLPARLQPIHSLQSHLCACWCAHSFASLTAPLAQRVSRCRTLRSCQHACRHTLCCGHAVYVYTASRCPANLCCVLACALWYGCLRGRQLGFAMQ